MAWFLEAVPVDSSLEDGGGAVESACWIGKTICFLSCFGVSVVSSRREKVDVFFK